MAALLSPLEEGGAQPAFSSPMTAKDRAVIKTNAIVPIVLRAIVVAGTNAGMRSTWDCRSFGPD
jgi:hypothetical protein